jgi:ribose transport system ATP-binding protein
MCLSAEYRLEMKDIKKSFGAVRALDGVSLQVRPGEVHALVGENGAGKSTLMKILSGAYRKDAGEIYLDGHRVEFSTPKDAKDLGISVIYQEFMLAPDLTVAENVFIDKLSAGGILIQWSKLRENTAAQLQKLGFGDINPNAKVSSLTVAYQQVVEICKCLARETRVLVLDEPTAVLTFAEIKKLFDVIRKLKSDGVSVIYISHRLEEIFELSDRITVLKDGGYVDTVLTSETDKAKLVTMMVGRDMKQMFPERRAKIGEAVLEVDGLTSGSMVRGVSFKLHAGEVLGFYGLVGAGRTETMSAIFGSAAKDGGSVKFFGREINFKHPAEAVSSGLGMLPEDRKKMGLLLSKSLRVNTMLASLPKVTSRFGVINHSYEKKIVKEVLDSINTKYPSVDHDASSLSGGNQQKVALAKWISADCKCVVFDEPTRGVDVGAKTEIYKIINSLAENGVAIIMISSEMPEIIGMCDRAIVMRQGSIAGTAVEKGYLDENTLIKLAMGVS